MTKDETIEELFYRMEGQSEIGDGLFHRNGMLSLASARSERRRSQDSPTAYVMMTVTWLLQHRVEAL